MALVRRVLVTKASALVKLKFYSARVGGHAILALVRRVLVTKASALVKLKFYFPRVAWGVTQSWPRCEESL